MNKIFSKIKNIAIINLGYIGDVINASPVCIRLKKACPDSVLTFITINASAETAKKLPCVDDVELYDRRGTEKGLFNMLKKGISLRKKHFDLVIILDNSLRSAFFAFLTGAKYRVGRVGELRDVFLTHKIPNLEEEKNMQIHVSEHYMRTLKPLGLYTSDYFLEFKISDEDREFAKNFLDKQGIRNQRLIGLCPVTRNPQKDWDSKEAADFIRLVQNKYSCKVVLVGDDLGKRFANDIRDNGVSDFIDVCGQTSISQLGALIEHFETFITVDTGPMHIALALNIPVIALFYFEIYKKWGPKDMLKNKIIYSPKSAQINADTVFDALGNLSCAE